MYLGQELAALLLGKSRFLLMYKDQLPFNLSFIYSWIYAKTHIHDNVCSDVLVRSCQTVNFYFGTCNSKEKMWECMAFLCVPVRVCNITSGGSKNIPQVR